MDQAIILSRRALVLAAGASVLAAPAWAADAKPVKLNKVFPYLDTYLKIPAAQRSRFAPVYYFLEGGKPLTNARLFIVDGGVKTPLALTADGRAVRMPTLAQLQNGTLEDAGPPGAKRGVRLELHAAMAPATRLDAHELELAIGEGKAAVARIAGALAFAAPKIVSANFPGAPSGQAVLASGAAVNLPLDKGAPYYNPGKIAGARSIVLARAPSKILLGSSGA